MKELSLEGVPKIDRYFPNCFWGNVESVARFKFDIPSLALVYTNHTFEFKQGQIGARAENGVELDIYFSHENIPSSVTAKKFEDIYGGQVRKHTLKDKEHFFDFAAAELNVGAPFVLSFDLFNLAKRREYGRVYNPHFVSVIGVDLTNKTLLVNEQMLGRAEIHESDLAGYFRLCSSTGIEATAYTLHSGGTAVDVEEQRNYVRKDLTFIASNLNSAEQTKGLNALNEAEKYLSGLVQADRSKTPFSVPGLWAFSHDRHQLGRYLKELNGQEAFGGADLAAELKRLDYLFSQWFSVDMYLEKALHTGDYGISETAVLKIRKLVEEERAFAEEILALTSKLDLG